MSNTRTAKLRTKTTTPKTPIANVEQHQGALDNAEVTTLEEITPPETNLQNEGDATAQIMQTEQPNDITLTDVDVDVDVDVDAQIPDAYFVTEAGEAHAEPTREEVNDAHRDTTLTNSSVLEDNRGQPTDSVHSTDTTPEPHTTETQSREESPRKKAKRQKQPLNPTFETARAEVARLRADLIAALDSKASILGVTRIGEAVPLRHSNAEIAHIDQEIQRVATELKTLRQRKRELVNGLVSNSADLDAVNREISRITKERKAARERKKASYNSAIAAPPHD